MTRNDSIVMGPAVSGAVLRMLLLAVVAASAMVLSPLIGWYVTAVVLAAIAALIPRSLAAWGAMICLVVGMILAGPDLGRTMLAVLVVPPLHVLASLSLVTTARTRVSLTALWPTLRRLLLVQAIAQPVTVAVALGGQFASSAYPWVAAAGGAALLAAMILLIRRLIR